MLRREQLLLRRRLPKKAIAVAGAATPDYS
jgi:hypothetical protein